MRESKTVRITGSRRSSAGRSGGVVDAPGKKHRKPAPNVAISRSQATVADASHATRVRAVQGRRRGGR